MEDKINSLIEVVKLINRKVSYGHTVSSQTETMLAIEEMLEDIKTGGNK